MAEKKRLVALLAGIFILAIAIPPATTAFNAYYTRALIRDQRQAGWKLQELSGDHDSSRLEVILRPTGQLVLPISARLRHRTLTTDFKGTIGPNATPFANFEGYISYTPWTGTVSWNIRFLGDRLSMDALKLHAWKASILGDTEKTQVKIDLPELRLPDYGALRGAQLALELLHPESQPSDLELDLTLAGGKWRKQGALLDVGASRLGLQVQHDGIQWPFHLTLNSTDIVNRGFPFVRVATLSHSAEGSVKEALSPLAGYSWNVRQSMEASTGYGPLNMAVRGDGITQADRTTHLNRLKVSGTVPAGVWAVMEQLAPALTRGLSADHPASNTDLQVRLDGIFRDGAWHSSGQFRDETNSLKGARHD